MAISEQDFQDHMNTLRGEPFRSVDDNTYSYEGHHFHNPRERAVCADGFTVSIQGGWGKYSSPRCDYSNTYSMWELGFPSERPTDAVMQYAEDKDGDPTNTVYGYVPTGKVIELIEAHGGFTLPTEESE